MSHQQAILCTCPYLKAMEDKGLSFHPTNKLTLDCYVDANFASLYNVENHTGPVCVKSCTSFVLLLGSCPLYWSSKLQMEVTLSMTKAEYITLSQAMRALLPLHSLLHEVGTKMDLSFSNVSVIKTQILEDNNGALSLANNSYQDQHMNKTYGYQVSFFSTVHRQ